MPPTTHSPPARKLGFTNNFSNKITQKQVMSHYFGFGTLQFEKITEDSRNNNSVTLIDGSNKFHEKLMLKQKEVEVSQTA